MMHLASGMERKLKIFATVRAGYSFREGIGQSPVGEIAVIQMRDLDPATRAVDFRKMSRTSIPNLGERNLVRKGDLIFRTRGETVNSSFVKNDPGRCVVAAPLLHIRVERLDWVMPEYLNWFISQPQAQAYFHAQATGSSQKVINKRILESLTVSIPDLETQRRIVDIADLSLRESFLLNKLAEKKSKYVSGVLIRKVNGG
ncbi:MAG: restriction endonuclease subunit S [Candidatus Aminicenantes bacterium]|nr:restriction endonuclease subunit S [Candidatus Aminicenantes bacterium]